MTSQFLQIKGAHFTNASKSTWHKITSSRLTIFYVVFSLVYCVIQIAISSRAFIDNSSADALLTSITVGADARNKSIPLFVNNGLALCASSPVNQNFTCNFVWNGKPGNNIIGEEARDSLSRRDSMIMLQERGRTFDISQDAPFSFYLNGMGFDNTPAKLDLSCVWSLNYPIYQLVHSERENIAFISFQIWVFMMSMVGVINESIPHIIASLLTHFMAMLWAVFEVIQTVDFERGFKTVISNGACSGANFLPGFFNLRYRTGFPTLAINIVALGLSCFLTWRLIKLLNWSNFKIVGANLNMNRYRKITLILFINIQLSLFFIIVYMALWLDMLVKGNMTQSSSFPALYKSFCIVILIFCAPWLALGWYAVRREMRIAMFLFLGLALIYLGAWSSTFFITSFNQEFKNWPFFAIIGIMSVIMVSFSFILGVVCRFNFGKGYSLPTQIALPPSPDVANDDEKIDLEKQFVSLTDSPHKEEVIEFPLPTPIPQITYTPPAPPISNAGVATSSGGNRMGPRFFQNITQPFESLTRNLTNGFVAPEDSPSIAPSTPTRNEFPPKYTDSISSFGNARGLSASTAGFNRGRSTNGLDRNATAMTTDSMGSMYTTGQPAGGLDYSDTWSSFGSTKQGRDYAQGPAL